MREEILRLENVNKFIDDAALLKDFNLNMFKGEILGLLSQNTNSKDYLTDLLCGKCKVDNGRIYFNDKIIQEEDYSTLNEHGIFSIERASKLCMDLTVSDNIFIIRNGFKKYIINKEVLNRQIKNIFDEFEIIINPNSRVAKLKKLECSIVELIKAYAIGAKIIILNDLTSYLSTVDIEKFNKIVIAMREKGISFLYIDSYLEVLFEISDRIVIMYGGRNIKSFKKGEIHRDTAISILMGKNFKFDYSRSKTPSGKEVLKFKDIYAHGLEAINFTVFTKEVVSIIDVTGKGTKAILNILKGDQIQYAGEIKLCGENYMVRDECRAIAKGVGFICENPIENMLFKDMTVSDNLCFLLSNKVKWFWLRKNIKKAIIKEYSTRLGDNIYATSIDEVDREILQRLVYYKWQLYSPKLLVCIKPFTGLDMIFRKLTLSLIQELSHKGISVMILTSNITEAYTIGDRIIVINEGKVISEFKKNEITLEEINELITRNFKGT